MRIVVISDAHGTTSLAEKAVMEQPKAEYVVFLGDGCERLECLESLTAAKVILLSGNCDFCSPYPRETLFEAGGHKVFAAHGHTFGVKQGIGVMIKETAMRGADIMLYGHTHQCHTNYQNGIYIMNPGTVSRGALSPTYGLVDITPAGVLMSIIKFND